MNQSIPVQSGAGAVLNRLRTFFSKPHNVILLILGIILTVTTVAPIVAIVQDTFKIHPGTIDAHLTGKSEGYTIVNYIDLFTSNVAKTNLWTPLWNTVLLSVGSCFVAVLYGGLFAFLVTRSNLAWKKYLSSIFIFPYIMPQWTLAVVWQNVFNSNAVTGTSNGLLAATLGVQMPMWWCKGLFPSVIVLGLHYSAFAYILVGGIFRNMDANLEEAATILDTPKWKTMFRVTLPMVKPAILSTILLVFSSAMGSYPVPHYLGLTTLSTKYVSLNSRYTGEASILAIIMMIFGIVIMLMNQMSLRSRKSYTTVTGKSGQSSKINLGKARALHYRAHPRRPHLLHQHLPHRLLCLRNLPAEPRRLQLPLHRRRLEPHDKVVDDQRKHHRERHVRPERHPIQPNHLVCLQGHHTRVGMLCPARRNHRHDDRLRRGQKAPK